MKFDTPAGTNPIDQLTVVGKPVDRIDGPLKTTGQAPYAYEHHDLPGQAAYGHVVGAGIAKGTIRSIDLSAARKAPGVLGIVTAQNAGKLQKGKFNTAKLLGGPEIAHYHQAIAVVVAETFEQARAAGQLIKVDYGRHVGAYDLEKARAGATVTKKGDAPNSNVGNFDAAFATAPVQLDAEYSTPDHSHAMMEPHASIAMWDGDKLSVWTSNQMINWGAGDLARTLGIPRENVRIMSPYVGGGFGGKLFLRADAVLASLAARQVGRPVKVMLPRPLIANNTTHRPATLQHIRLGAGRDGKLTAIAHESWSGDLPDGSPEIAAAQTQLLYAGANRLIHDPSGRARSARRQRHARAGRGTRIDGVGNRHGRDGRKARHGPGQVPHRQRHPGGPGKPAATVLAASAGHVPGRWRKAIRVVQAQGQAGQYARWSLAGRHGRCGGISQRAGHDLRRTHAAGAGRARGGGNRHDRYRDRLLHHHCADRCGNAGRPTQLGRCAPGRFELSGLCRLRRAVGREQFYRRRLCSRSQIARSGGQATGPGSGQCRVCRWLCACRRQARCARRCRGQWRAGGGRQDRIRRPQQNAPALHVRRAFRRSGRGYRNRRSAHPAHACRVRRGAHPQSQIRTQPGHRRHDHGRRRGTDGRAGSGQTPGLFRQPRPGRL
ncbi:hypothetical protein XAB3213_3280028 [Xanthomonas citri pv. bilvae]|nr:hypothetical protein XAB3213_3280028 [Xanthomonas citri pv. bilvae]